MSINDFISPFVIPNSGTAFRITEKGVGELREEIRPIGVTPGQWMSFDRECFPSTDETQVYGNLFLLYDSGGKPNAGGIMIPRDRVLFDAVRFPDGEIRPLGKER